MRVAIQLLVVLLVSCGVAHAQSSYPNKPMRLVVGFPAGGPSDMFARTIAQKLTEIIGHQVVVDNRAGVNGMMAAEYVAKSVPAVPTADRTKREATQLELYRWFSEWGAHARNADPGRAALIGLGLAERRKKADDNTPDVPLPSPTSGASAA